MKINIRVPASTANLGSGVDCLGLALAIYLNVTIETAQDNCVTFGKGFDAPLDDRDNLILTAIRKVECALGRQLPPVHITIESDIPLTRGMGSSASAIAAGIMAADALLDAHLSDAKKLDLAAEIEGHPDNVAPALFGGFTVATQLSSGSFTALRYPAPRLDAVLAIPDTGLSTSLARSVLPQQVALHDAVSQVQRACTMVAALTSEQYELLRDAASDALFTPARKELIPAFDEVTHAAYDAGALCAMISGAGPSIIALTRGHADEVASAMQAAYDKAGVSGSIRLVELDDAGAKVTVLDERRSL